MLGGYWLLITFALLGAAVVLHQVPLLLVASLFFLASGTARLWARYALAGVQYSRRLSATRAFFGETITLETCIANRKMLPLPQVRIEDEVPEELTFLKGKISPSHKAARAVLSSLLSLSWYHQITRRYPVQCPRRGYFAFGPATIRSGDPFGFFDKEISVTEPDHLLVYPRIVSLEALGIPSRNPFGDLRARRHLFQDPVRAVTTRDYAYGDPLKRIHWKATARLRRLQSRVFEPTTTVDLALFLDARTVLPPLWGSSEQLLETAIIVAASIANHALDEGYSVGLFANENYTFTDRMVRLPPSVHPDQLQRILEALAHIRGFPFIALEQTLSQETPNLPWATTVVAITAAPTEGVLASLNRLRHAGRRVALILVGEQSARLSVDRMPVYHVSDNVYWREMSSLKIGHGIPGKARRLKESE